MNLENQIFQTKRLGTFGNLHLFVGIDSSIHYIRADYDFGYFAGYHVDSNSFGCDHSNFALYHNAPLDR